MFLSVPTGFGKSLVYQLLSFCAERLLKTQPLQGMPVVVISPLVSLMYDQVSKLLRKNVRALCISGDQNAANDVYRGGRRSCDAFVRKPRGLYSMKSGVLPLWTDPLFNTGCSYNYACVAISMCVLKGV